MGRYDTPAARRLASLGLLVYSGLTPMAKPKRGETIEIVIDDLAFGGEGVGRLDGYVMFVRGGLPGDRLRVRVVEARGRFGRGAIDAVLMPSPHRVEAPCPYFGQCGGCRLQHLAYPAQLAFKEKQVRDCLERLGGLPPFELRPIVPAPAPYGYRNKMEFTVAEPGPAVGLHVAERYDVVLDIERCLLQSEDMNALLDEVRRQVRARGLSVWEQRTERGLLRFVTLREGRNTGEAMVNVVASAPDVAALVPVAEALKTRVPAIASVVLNVNDTKSSVAIGSEEHLLLGRDHITESLSGVRFQVSANSFFQTNTVQAERLFAIAAEACALDGTETVLDLYSGTGAITLLLARHARHVYGIELSAAAVADATRNARANSIDNVTFLTGEVRHVLPALAGDGVRPSVVVADPPRAGFHPKALAALAGLAPARIVYVSCNPATLARDVGDLARQGYRLEWVQPVDMFPQTPHIEAVARLSRA
jgi:23S rRNA (uracil1939-C5)-methyltransferase